MPVSRFAALAGIPERTYRYRLARLRSGAMRGPWPAPAVDAIEELAAKYAESWPAWGHRKIAALLRADGHAVSTSTGIFVSTPLSESSNEIRTCVSRSLPRIG